MFQNKVPVRINNPLSSAGMVVSAIVLALLPQSSISADEPTKGIFVGINLESHNASAHYPDFQWIGSALQYDSVGGKQPILNYHAGDIGIAVAGRLGNSVRIEPSLNLFFGFGGGTKPTTNDTSVAVSNYLLPSSDTSFHPPAGHASYSRRRYDTEQYVGVNFAADVGVRAGIPFTLGSWVLTPMVGVKGNLLWTSATENFCGSYYWLILPVGLSLSHGMGEKWRFGGELSAEPVVLGAANWALNIIVAGIEGEFVNLGTPIGFSGCLKFSRLSRRGALELSPYVTWFHHERSNVAGSNLRVGWWNVNDEGTGMKWFEPTGSTLRIGVRAGWFFAFGRKQREGDEE